MRWIRRLSLSAGVAGAATAIFTIAAIGAGGGGFGLGGGKFTFTDTSAFVNTFNPVDGSSLNLSVDHTTFLFRQRPNAGMQSGVMTILNISQFIPDPTNPQGGTSNNICLQIPDSSFTVSADLQTATLNALDQSNVCPFFIASQTGAVIEAGGGGGGTGGFTLPISVAVTWTGSGAVTISDNNGTSRCLTFVAITQNHGQQVLSAAVSGSISGVGGFSGGTASGIFGIVTLNSSVQTVAGQGILPPPCGGQGK